MAVLVIDEFESMARNGVPIPQYPPIARQQITIGASSVAATNPFNARTRFIRLTAGATCRFKIGSGAQTAADDATSGYLPSGTILDAGVQGGHTISAITAA